MLDLINTAGLNVQRMRWEHVACPFIFLSSVHCLPSTCRNHKASIIDTAQMHLSPTFFEVLRLSQLFVGTLNSIFG